MNAFEVCFRKENLFHNFCIFFVKDQRNRLSDLVVKSKDLKTKLYDECLSKDLVKILMDKIEQMIVSLLRI
jgi:hypothetical protein